MKDIWYAEKTTFDDTYGHNDRLPRWIIKDSTITQKLNQDQLKYTELGVVCKIQGNDKDAEKYKDMILKAINNQ